MTCYTRHKLVEVIQVGVLVLKILEEVLGLERLAHGAHQQLVHRLGHGALRVHLLVEPVPDGREVARLDLGVEVGHLQPHVVLQLRGHDGAEEVGGEVADGETGPVDVLQTATTVVRHVHCEQLLHARIPPGWELLHFHLAAQQRTLQLEAHHHVHRICEFVGLHADQRLAHGVGGPVQLLVARREPEASAHLAARILPKGAREAHVPLPEERLRLVHAHAQRGVHGHPRAAERTLVHGVPGLVDRAGEALVPLVRAEAGGDAHVRRAEGGGEGVDGHVDAPLLEAEVAHDLSVERYLRLRTERAAQRRAARLVRRGEDLCDERLEHGLHFGEEDLATRSRHPGLELVECHIVELRFVRARVPGHLGSDGEALGEHRAEALEVVGGARLCPAGVC
mmetsp:Transcript_22913/g.58171  ORF Transcript_22913/g.58171 Transcript_22913/m.58171 type:complete len:395 (+) Transcript_22913:42-1226(+)